VQRIRTLSATVSDAEAEELAHDIFLRVFNSLSKFDAARGSLAGFISVITRSRVIEHWRRWHIQDKATKSIDEVALSAPRFAIQRGLDRELVGRISLAVASSMNTERKKHVAAELVRQQTVTEVVQKTGLSRDQVYAVRNELEPLLVAAFEAVQFSKNLQ
jgi:DNA-directed RNA polymerase specialized sigma24 family protein